MLKLNSPLPLLSKLDDLYLKIESYRDRDYNIWKELFFYQGVIKAIEKEVLDIIEDSNNIVREYNILIQYIHDYERTDLM